MPVPASRNAALIATGCLLGVFVLSNPWPSHAKSRKNASSAKRMNKAATTHYDAGRYQKAAELYHSAFKATKRPSHLFNAARAEQRAFLYEAATRDFNRYLELKPKNPKGERRAQLHLKEIREIQARAAAAKIKIAKDEAVHIQTRPPTVAQQASPAAWKAPVTWSLLGVGAAATGLGAWWAISALSDGDALDEKLAKKDGQGIVGISHADAEAKRQDINSRLVRSYVSTGVGLAAVGAGLWMLLSRSQRSSMALLPSRDGPQMAWLVRF